MVVLPSFLNDVGPTARFFTIAKEHEQFLQYRIPTDAVASSIELVYRDKHTTRITHGDTSSASDNKDISLLGEIAMNQAVCQCFSQCNMRRAFLLTIYAFQYEWRGQQLGQLQISLIEELVKQLQQKFFEGMKQQTGK